MLENEILYGKRFDVPQLDDWTVPIGVAKIARPGADVSVVSWGIGMTYALQAAQELAGDLDVEVIDLRSLRPYDLPSVLASVRKTNRCVIVEEGWPQCSMSSEIAARVQSEAFDHLDAPVLCVSGRDVPLPYAANLEKLALPSVSEVIGAVKAVAYRT